MSDFLLSIFKGLYPFYFFFGILGVAARMYLRRWRRFDTLLLAGFLFFDLLAAFQVWIFYGIFTTSKRYLWMAIPLYLPFAAQGVSALYGLMKRFLPFGRLLFAVGMIVLAALSVYNFYTPVINDYLPGKKRAPRLLALQAAELIRRDWAAQPAPGVFTLLKCDQYQSGRRPLVQAHHKVLQAGYLCGGQAYLDFLSAAGVPPDYILSASPEAPAGYLGIGAVSAAEKTLYIHRRQEPPRPYPAVTPERR